MAQYDMICYDMYEGDGNGSTGNLGINFNPGPSKTLALALGLAMVELFYGLCGKLEVALNYS